MNTSTKNNPAFAPIPALAKAARIHSYGAPDVINLEDVKVTMPAEGEVLVQVKAAGVLARGTPGSAPARACRRSRSPSAPTCRASSLPPDRG
jgi:hypothetical protein